MLLRTGRAPLWGLLLLLLTVALSLLVWLTLRHESNKRQDAAESAAVASAAQVRSNLSTVTQGLQSITWVAPQAALWQESARELMQRHTALRRVEWRNARLSIVDSADSPFPPALFSHMRRDALDQPAELACLDARQTTSPSFSRSYFVPMRGGEGGETMDLCMPVLRDGVLAGFVVASLWLPTVLDTALSPDTRKGHEFSFVEADGTRVAMSGTQRGLGVYRADQRVNLPGHALQVRANSFDAAPSLIPNLATALVLSLSLGLFGLVFLLAQDVRRRAAAEAALAESLRFRQAMENSLSTGLRARNMDGTITYVNPAFCAMVGYDAQTLLNVRPPDPPPYWPPEMMQEYAQRQRDRQEGKRSDPHEGHETVFMRKNGERFPVMIYEAPLMDGVGKQRGWMGSVLDLTARRRIEDLARQQQERLHATARLASVGEMASLLSHELNQPLAAIASYASGSLNMLDDASTRDGRHAPHDASTIAMMRQALQAIDEQAERAGRVIKSVQDFARRRGPMRQPVLARELVEGVLPLVRMQARKGHAMVDTSVSTGAHERPLRVVCDRTMIEQVLLNLSRNGIQAMESMPPARPRVLTLRVEPVQPSSVRFEVIDSGEGIAPEVAQHLFTPFFTTRAEGMGLGLSLCRTVVEQHGGTLDFGPGPDGVGTAFRFTLPAAGASIGHATPSGETPIDGETASAQKQPTDQA